MKKAIVVGALCLAVASPVFGMGQRGGGMNFKLFGSDDNKHYGRVNTTSIPPTTPTPVPEPATFLLLGAGLVGLGIISRKKK